MEMDAVQKLTKDLKEAAKMLSADEARYLVDYYYLAQEDRIRAGHQVRTLKEGEEPHEVIAWLGSNVGILEAQVRRALASYADASPLGRWSQSIVGIGPIIAAGLLAHINLEPWRCGLAKLDATVTPCTEKEPHDNAHCGHAPLMTVGSIWRFAGLDPTSVWNKNEKRPWNASLKTLCWKIGESFVKVSSNEHDFYGKLYLSRKNDEMQRNVAGEYSAQATAKLEKFKIGKDTDARLWYGGHLTADAARQILNAPSEKRMGMAKKLAGAAGSGVPMLPPAHIHSRAKRWAVKLFLSHYHYVAFSLAYGQAPPKPYILNEAGGHAHEIVAPNWPMSE